MRFKLMKNNETYYLLLNSGVMRIVSKAEAFDAVIYFDEYLEDNCDNADFHSLFDDVGGELIASLTKEGFLYIHDAKLYRELLTPTTTESFPYCCLSDYAKSKGKSPTNVRKYCRASRIPGAVLVGPTWLIPKKAPYPDDNRCNPPKPIIPTTEQTELDD